MIGTLGVNLSELLSFCEKFEYRCTLSRNLVSRQGSSPCKIITGIEPIQESSANDLTFCRFVNETADSWIKTSNAGFVIVANEYFGSPKLSEDTTYIFAEHPRLALLNFINAFWQRDSQDADQPSAVHPSAKIGKNVSIGRFCVIGSDVEIGDNTTIGHNVTIFHARIGSRCYIGSNSNIGGEGFGYEDEADSVLSFPHLGGVIIGDDVRIGSCTCVDRASLGNTIIGDDVKIDNLVHIAHNVKIKRAAKVVAMTIVGGSTKIGENAWIAPGVALRDWVTIGDNALVGLGAVVTKDVQNDDAVVGNPAKSIPKTRKRYR